MFKIFEPYKDLVTLFSLKEDGPMKITDDKRNFANRLKFLNKNNISEGDLYVGRLQHTNNVAVVKNRDSRMFSNCDGLVTNQPNTFLSFTVADCTAVYLLDPENKAIGLLHAGWKGLKDEIIKNAIELMQANFNSKSENILVGISAIMCSKCYEVQPDFISNFSNYPNAFIQRDNKIFFDSKNVILSQLSSLGIKENNIEFINECTYCLSDKYFSYRRDQYGCDPDDRNAMMAVFGIKH